MPYFSAGNNLKLKDPFYIILNITTLLI